MHIQPYLFFNGRCEEAIEFYKTALGAKVEFLMRNKESPEPHQPGVLPPGSENKVLHATIRIGNTLMNASDGHCQGQPKFEGFSLSLNVPTVTEAEKVFAALALGGQVQMPLAKTFFSPKFGMVADRFGVGWLVLTAP